MTRVVSIWMDGLRGQILDKKLDFEGNVQKSKKMSENLINRLKKRRYIKSTLGGCIVEEKNNFILISKELKIRNSTRKMLYQPKI